MTVQQQIALKNSLKQFCQHTIEQRMVAARAVVQAAQEAANHEEKSSAGDKYETGRALGHLQKDMHARQLSACMLELSELHRINTGVRYDNACAGAFIDTDMAGFFIAAGLGRHMVEGQPVFFLSPHAPLAHLLQNKKAGDHFNFNGARLLIKSIY